MAGEDAEEGGGDGGDGGENPLIVAVAVVGFHDFAGEIGAIDVTAEIPFDREIAGRIAGNGHEGNECPVAEQNDERDEDETTRFEEPGEKGGDAVTDADTLEDAGVAEIFEIETEESVIDEAEEDEEEDTSKDAAGELGGGFATGAVGAEGEGDDDADEEEEEREDEVVEDEALPWDVFELGFGDGFGGGAEIFAEGAEEGVAADDPEHIEATEGVDGEESGRRRWWRGGVGGVEVGIGRGCGG